MNLELFMLDGSNVERAQETLAAVLETLPRCFFSAAHLCSPEAGFYSPYDIQLHDAPIIYGNRRRYNEYVIKELPKLVTVDHFMIIHRDGYPLNPEKWEDEFLKYDYIGAPWGPEPWAVGNGGFCIRSRKFALWAAERVTNFDLNEDHVLCVEMRAEAEAAGFSFAPIETAARFSLERDIPELPRTLKDVFGFHGVHDRLNLLL
jgi:hypothetical protein